MPAPFSEYEIDAAYDEMFRARGRPRPHYKNLYTQLLNLPSEELYRCKKEADLSFFNQGITFTVYGRAEGTEQIFPHDLLPRIITSSEWATIERGLTQRITALNLFLADVYHERPHPEGPRSSPARLSIPASTSAGRCTGSKFRATCMSAWWGPT